MQLEQPCRWQTQKRRHQLQVVPLPVVRAVLAPAIKYTTYLGKYLGLCQPRLSMLVHSRQHHRRDIKPVATLVATGEKNNNFYSWIEATQQFERATQSL